MSFFESLPNLEGITEVAPENYLFIDTETTGLSGGTGTYVFLAGAAKYEKGSLNFAQFFLQDPAKESAQLSALETFVSSAKIIVSYNGKSFDLPRIRTRYRFHGWPDPFENIYHIDLLHHARRIWKNNLPSCTLGDLEQRIIGLQRSNLDIPGWKVSEHFYEYLNTLNPAPLENVFYHNEVDVISLAALLETIAGRLSSPLRDPTNENNDLISLGKYFFDVGLYSQAEQVLSTALSSHDYSDEIILTGKLCLAAIYKKSGNYSSAASYWNECAEKESFDAYLELAKHHEHNLGDFETAIHWTLTALEALDSFAANKRQVLTDQLNHRLQRLKKRVQR
jgi:uncharacterized protein YprB with RNaseH-like and TPR domain